MEVSKLVEHLIQIEDRSEQQKLLVEQARSLDASEMDVLAQLLKEHADRLMRTNIQQCLQVAGLIEILAQKTGSPFQQAQWLLAMGNANTVVLGDYHQGLDYYNRAIVIFQKQGWSKLEARTKIGRMWDYAALGDYEHAFEDAEQAQITLRELQEWFHLARLQSNLAAIHARLSQYPQALELFDQAMRTYQKLGIEGQPHWLRLEINRANVLRYLGRFEESMQASRHAIEMHRQLGQTVAAARAQQTLAITLYVLGRYNEALTLLDEVREVLRQDGRQRQSVLVELFSSDCLLQLRRFGDVIEKCRQVRALFSELGTRFEVGQAILNEARAYAGLQRFNQAQNSLAEARQIFEAEGNRVAIAEADLQSAMVAFDQTQPGLSYSLAIECLQVFKSEDMPVWEAQANLVIARAALALGQTDQVSQAVQAALAVGERYSLPALTYPGHHLLGKLAVQKDSPEEGLAELEQAVQELERLCGRLMIEFRAAFVEDKGLVYEEAVSLCLDLERPWQGLEFAERAKSRALLDMLSHRLDLSITARSPADQPVVEELTRLRRERDQLYRHLDGEGFGQRGDTDSFQEVRLTGESRVHQLEKRITDLWHKLLIHNADYAREASLWQVRTEPIQPYLDEETVLLVYFAIAGKLVVFRVVKKAIQAVHLDVTLDEIRRRLQLLWLNLQSVPRRTPQQQLGLKRNAQGILKHLYDQLIAPLHLPGEQGLGSYKHLVVVPHGVLHYLPFQALFDGEAYLLENYEISYLPGASFLRFCVGNGSDRMQPLQTNKRLTAIGNSSQERLPYTVEEALAIASLWDGQALVEEQATLEAFRRLAPKSVAIHLAAHGDFRPDNPLFSGLALADGWLTTLDIFNMRLNASLVTLSACQTGRSVVGGGDELLGLMRSFLAAGAATLVATLWAVEDRSTAQLMSSFYGRLAGGETKGAALRRAQLELMDGRSSQQDFSHPYFWAPFSLVGNWGQL
jgi:CHAT domain-containing protein/tetratricopeptide (TPR) repeat protein